MPEGRMAEETFTSVADRQAATAKLKRHIARCSFCGKSQSDVKILVAGPAVFICNKCIRVCSKVVEKALKSGEAESAKQPFGEMLLSLPTESLRSALASQEAMLERTRTQMQLTVELLRERGISWAAIGETLNVSRQAVWERFS
jgi:hypothetical protein